jgi:TonB-dependent receptor
MKFLNALLLLLVCSLGIAQAQNGTLRGTLIDDKTGETLIGVTVLLEGTSTGTITDLDGNYNISAPAGTYTVVFSYISYATKKVTDVVIKAGEVTVIDLRLAGETEKINEVTISAERTKNTENALLTIQKNSTVVLDGISSQSIGKSGDNNAADALRRVPGVSVEGGKYIYVRGLGDRYTKTMLNGMEIPGLDPDRNTVQMDIFPSNLIDNLIVYKTFSPDLPGDFTGGVVDIATKSFQERKQLTVGGTWGYTTGTTFNKNFILYKGGKTDALGFDDGTRKLPFDYDLTIGNGLAITKDPKLEEYTRSFSRQLEAKKEMAFFNQNYFIGFGNQYNKNGKSFGINTGFTYRNTYQFYEKVELGEYQHDFRSSVLQFDKENYRISSGPQGSNNVIWSALFAAAYKTQKNKYTLQLFHTQNGESTASKRAQYDGFNEINTISDILTYTQRSMSNALVTGKHKLNKIDMEWKNSFTYSKISDPDLRIMQFRVIDSDTILEAGGSSRSNRIFRDLSEITENFRVDFTLPFKQWNGLTSKFKFGMFDTYKRRSFQSYVVELENNGLQVEGGADYLLAEQNIWDAETNPNGTYVTGQQDKANTFDASMNVLAGYVMNELPITNRFNLIYGLRIEKADILFTGQKQQIFNPETDKYTNEKVLDEINFLPAVNMVYNVIENMNFRVSYSRTVARPSFKEKSLAQIFDPVTEITFIGNIDLKQTDIDNVDFRWEYFFGSGEMISASAFFKNFNNPIEIVVYSDVAPRDFTPRNVSNARAYGLEFEFRKNFKFIHKKLEGLVIGGNLTWVKSVTEMNPAELEGRNKWVKDGYTISNKRVMYGQSPYIVNASLSYTAEKIGLTATMVYNVQGKRLSVVGGGRAPDVYDMPFHSLNFKLTEVFGKKDQFKVSVQAQNLVGDDLVRQYESYYGADPAIFQRLVPGRTFSVGFTYTIQ